MTEQLEKMKNEKSDPEAALWANRQAQKHAAKDIQSLV